jgi:hypothetical protein
MKRTPILSSVTSSLALVALVALGAVAACSQPATSSSRGGAPSSDGLAAFETVRSVLQHPRCQNCHPRGDVPLQGDDGRPHNQNVLRGPDGKGMVGQRCTTCHGPANPPDTYGAHTPPGASTGWRMPKPDERLVFVGVAPGALCQQIKRPARGVGLVARLRPHSDPRPARDLPRRLDHLGQRRRALPEVS